MRVSVMKERLLKASKAIIGLAAVSSVLVAPALAQEIKPLDVYQDPHGIDLVSNNVSTSQAPTMSIPAAPELAFRDLADFVPVIEVKIGTAPPGFDPEVYRVTAGAIASDAFALCSTDTCYSTKGTGSKLLLGGDEGGPGLGLGGYQYTQGGTGKYIQFSLQTEKPGGTIDPPVKKFLAYQVHNPGGRDLSFQYESASISNILRHRPSVVTSTGGYELHFTYWSNSADLNWGYVKKVEIVAVANPTVALASFEYLGNTVTDISGRVFDCVCAPSIFGNGNPQQKGSRLKLPGETAYSFNTTRQQGSNTRTVTSDGVTFTYVSVPDTGWTNTPDAIHDLTITGPNGFYKKIDVTNTQSTTGEFDPPRRRVDSITDSQGRITQYQYTPTERLRKIIYPEGNSVEVNYDTNGNLVERRAKAKPGSGETDLVETAYFTGTGCGLGFGCYRPQWTKDAKNNQTDFTWNVAHGGMLTRLDPVNEQGRRRKTKNTWSTTTPINGETCGSMTNAPFPGGTPRCTPRLIKEEICETDASGNELTCGTSQSFVRQITYFQATDLPASETITDGAGNGPLTTTYTYDAAGRMLSSDGPLPGTDDATYYRYDILGRRTWEIGPRGENGYRAASRTTYRSSDDQVTRIETGRISNPVDTNLIVFSQVDTDYNANRLASKSSVSAAGTTYSVTQTSYDTLNRIDCTATRMNSTIFGSLPASACTLGTAGPNGSDRISRNHYDTEGRIVRTEQGVGTSLRRDYATYTYTPNGQTASMTDARGFKASMLYDGFDRQTHWYFPNPGVTGAINPGDYERYWYDANGNRTQLRKRDGSTLTFQFDKLDRVTRKTVPERTGLSSSHTRDIFYKYDIRGLQTDARFDSLSGAGVVNVYDRYGRMSSATSFGRTLSYQYNAAGSRTRITHPDAKYWNYTYTSGGQFNQLTDQSGNVLADYNYNSKNELSAVNRYSSAPDQIWTYDPIGRMASTGWANAGSNSVTWSFTRNSASQILAETQSNDLYSWNGFAAVDRNYVANGLNQYSTVAGSGYCYDGNGNLTADNQYAYLYDIENRLVEMRARVGSTCPVAYTGQMKALLRYDPLGRLYQINNYINGVDQGTTHFTYDGDALVAEYNTAGSMLQRHIHGPSAGADDPLITYFGSSNATSAARFHFADARGSIVYTSNSSNGLLARNTYDEYGQPGSANAGRFQYTGQVWLEELGMSYYKARMYSPTLGRFLQTDPIGYEDNVNIYAYTGNDPINLVDPTGQNEEDPPEETDEPRSAVTGSRIERTASSAKSFAQANLVNTRVTTFSAKVSAHFSNTDGASRLTGLSISTAVNGRIRDQVWVDFNPQSANTAAFFAHVRDRHFGSDTRYKSVFRPVFQNELSVFHLAAFAANAAPLRDGKYAYTYTYTAQYTGPVGYLRGSGAPTRFLTLATVASGRIDEQGRRVLLPRSLYPGRPND